MLRSAVLGAAYMRNIILETKKAFILLYNNIQSSKQRWKSSIFHSQIWSVLEVQFNTVGTILAGSPIRYIFITVGTWDPSHIVYVEVSDTHISYTVSKLVLHVT